MSRAVSLVFGLHLMGSVLSTQGCGSPAAETTQAPETASGAEQAAASPKPPAKPMPAIELGGRLFDNWYAELGLEFVPDDPATPALDGKGGPFGNGTLPDSEGAPLANAGHGYT